MIKWDLFLELKDGSTSADQAMWYIYIHTHKYLCVYIYIHTHIYHINKMKNKYMFHSIDTENHLTRFNTHLWQKTLNKIGIEKSISMYKGLEDTKKWKDIPRSAHGLTLLKC